ncbi:MAG: WGR domain-containing protein, partial [Spirochaetales bacterium]|nr:WGR domain-containing protein [Spirochaetales bacterium]
MEKYLTYEDGTSKKFWKVQTSNKQVTVTFGRMGTAGQTQTREYASPADAEKDAAKQAAAKLKKGYKESSPPAASPSPAAASKASPAKKSAPKTEAGPAPMADDGQPKPWHDSKNWDYPWYCGDEAAFMNLDKPLEAEDGGEQKTSARKSALSIPEGVVFDDDDDDDERMEKILLFLPIGEAIAYLRVRFSSKEKNAGSDEARMRDYAAYNLKRYCQWPVSYHTDCGKWIDILRQLTPDDKAFKTQVSVCLAEGMEDALDTSYADEDKIAHIQWLLENGAPIEGKYKINCEYIRHFVAEYKKNPNPAGVSGIFAAYREDFCKKHAQGYAEGLVRFLTYLATGEDINSKSPGTIAVPETTAGLTHFELDLGGLTAKPHNNTWYKFGFEYGGIYAWEGAVDMQKRLAPVLQKMAAEGAFDKIKPGLLARGLSILHVECNRGKNKPFLHLALDEAAAKAQTDALESLIAGLEEHAESGNFDAVTEESLETAGSALLDEVYLPRDIPRFRRLMEKYTYNLHNPKIAGTARQLTGKNDHLDSALKNDWSAHALLNYNDRWSKKSIV